MQLTHQRVFITGGNGGLGSAIAREFSAQGAQVTCVSRSNPVAEAVPNPPTTIVHDQADVTDVSSLDAAVQRAVARWGGIDVLVTCAGQMIDGEGHRIKLDDVRAMLETNVVGTLAAVQATVEHLRATGNGRIVTISSAIAHVATRGTCAYAASKAAVEAMTRTLAAELAPNVRVNALAPGFVDAGLTADLIANQQHWPRYQHNIAAGRPGAAEEIARAAVFLASPASSYINGAVLAVDGGLTWPC